MSLRTVSVFAGWATVAAYYVPQDFNVPTYTSDDGLGRRRHLLAPYSLEVNVSVSPPSERGDDVETTTALDESAVFLAKVNASELPPRLPVIDLETSAAEEESAVLRAKVNASVLSPRLSASDLETSIADEESAVLRAKAFAANDRPKIFLASFPQTGFGIAGARATINALRLLIGNHTKMLRTYLGHGSFHAVEPGEFRQTSTEEEDGEGADFVEFTSSSGHGEVLDSSAAGWLAESDSPLPWKLAVVFFASLFVIAMFVMCLWLAIRGDRAKGWWWFSTYRQGESKIVEVDSDTLEYTQNLKEKDVDQLVHLLDRILQKSAVNPADVLGLGYDCESQHVAFMPGTRPSLPGHTLQRWRYGFVGCWTSLDALTLGSPALFLCPLRSILNVEVCPIVEGVRQTDDGQAGSATVRLTSSAPVERGNSVSIYFGRQRDAELWARVFTTILERLKEEPAEMA